MTTLSIDLETYSTVDLQKSGLYAYAESPDTKILLFGFAFDDDPVQVIDVAQHEYFPNDLVRALTDPKVLKTAWNAAFEYAVISKQYTGNLVTEQWACSMVHSYYLGLPGKLETAAKTLNLEAQKDTAGEALIRYFSKPCKPTAANGGRTRNLPEHDPEKWAQFKAYCAQDVEVEREIRRKLERIPIPEKEHRLWVPDQKINSLGVQIDRDLVHHAIKCDQRHQERLLSEAERLTGLDNPGSVSQLKTWLLEAANLEVESLNKKVIPELLKRTDSAKVQRVLELRQEMAKTSTKKYVAMQNACCADNRVRGLLQFYGATRSGRWAGRLVQVQNLPRNSMAQLELAREFLREGNYEALELLWESVPNTLSQLIRTAFVAPPGKVFVVSDFSAIEARVIAWLAGEQWRLDVFNSHGKIYEASASQMFKVPIESIDKHSPLRQKGKVSELALGYQGGPGALITMGALDMGLTEDELPGLVNTWRSANPRIVQLWYDVGDAAMAAVRDRQTVRLKHGLVFSYDAGMLRIQLPSGRNLYYVRPRIEIDPRFNREGLTYEGQEQGKGWGRLRTYGGKLVENITQAVARDCLAEALLRLDAAGYDRIVFHVHDESVLETDPGEADKVAEIMGRPIEWAPGLPLRADAFETPYYRKED